MSASAARRRRAIDESISFTRFVARSTNFTTEFRATYNATELSRADRRVLADIAEPLDVIAIVEDWCPDVVASLPVLARVADEMAAISLHVVVRDDSTRDLADAYPYEGRSHIPTYVVSDASGAEIGVIHERTEPIRERVAEFVDFFLAAHPHVDAAQFPTGLTSADRAELRTASLRFRRQLRELERSSLVTTLRDFAVAAQPPVDADLYALPSSR
jgi:thiol-disulfide isomerase/thioredoxin